MLTTPEDPLAIVPRLRTKNTRYTKLESEHCSWGWAGFQFGLSRIQSLTGLISYLGLAGMSLYNAATEQEAPAAN